MSAVMAGARVPTAMASLYMSWYSEDRRNSLNLLMAELWTREKMSKCVSE